MSPRYVYDKLKKDFLQDKRPVPATSLGLPTECETLQDRIERLGGVSETCEPDNLPSVSVEQPSSVSMVTPTERTHGIFSEESVADIKTIFSDMSSITSPSPWLK